MGGFAGRGGKRLAAKCLLKTAVLNLLSYKIDARDVGTSVGCPRMLSISIEMWYFIYTERLLMSLESQAHRATAGIRVFLSSPAFLEERAKIDRMHVIIQRRK